ncbi:MAG: response regulator [Candidatus Rokuibacteriota bacterium]
MSAPPYQGATVLVVDDHEDSRAALRQLLESLGLQVLEAVDGLSALARLREFVPPLVLCDLRMPGLDGFAFMARARSDPKLHRVRVVALTGLTGRQDLVRIMEAGFDAYLPKPIDFDTVVAMLERLFSAEPRG